MKRAHSRAARSGRARSAAARSALDLPEAHAIPTVVLGQIGIAVEEPIAVLEVIAKEHVRIGAVAPGLRRVEIRIRVCRRRVGKDAEAGEEERASHHVSTIKPLARTGSYTSCARVTFSRTCGMPPLRSTRRRPAVHRSAP